MLIRSTMVLPALIAGAFVFAHPTAARKQGDESNPRLELLQHEWERQPGELRIALLLGGILRRDGRDEEARAVVESSVAEVEKRITSEGDSAELQYLLGTATLFLIQNTVALGHFQIALSLEPEREDIHLGLVRTLFNLERNEEAMEALQLATTLFPDSAAVKSQLAEANERTGHHSNAIPILEELRVLDPGDRSLFDRLLRAYVEVGDSGKAETLFQQLVDEGAISPIEAVLHMFRIHLAKGDLRTARADLQRASGIDPKDPLLGVAFREFYSLQATKAEEGGNHRRAVLFWERALESVPGDRQTQYRLALAQAALKNHQAALDLFLPLLEKRPADPDFYANLALTLIGLERFEAAGKVLQLGLRVAAEKGDDSIDAKLQYIRDRLAQEGIPVADGPAAMAR